MSAAAWWIMVVAAVWTVASLGGLALSAGFAMARPLLRRRRRRAPTGEPVSVVLPIKSLDTGFDIAQASVLRHLPLGSEVIVTARETASPALDTARRVFADAVVPVTFLHSTANFAVSPKVDNLVEAIAAARNDLIFMKDSNVELPPGGVVPGIGSLTEDVGLVCAIPRAIEAKTFAAAVEAQIMNQSHGRLLLLADAFGLGFGVGKIMVFRRSVLERIGGLAAVAHSVGEDSALQVAFAKIGLKTAFMPSVVTQRLGTRGWKDVFDRQMRWTAVRASNTKLAFAAEPLGLCVVAAMAAAIAAPLVGLHPLTGAALCLATWFAIETALALSEGWDVSVTAPAVMVARDSLMLAVWIRAWFTRRVVWAGNSVPVNRIGGLPLPAETPADRTKQRNNL